jgi:hypothetical protein
MGTKITRYSRGTCSSTTINNPTHRHGGNRGLCTQQVIEGIETRCEEKQDKTHENEKWIDDDWKTGETDLQALPEQGEDLTSVEVVTACVYCTLLYMSIFIHPHNMNAQ